MFSIDEVIADTEGEEGFKPSVYPDSRGYWTIGFGTLVDAKLNAGITRDEAIYLATNRLNGAIADLDRNLSWWRSLPEGPADAIAELCFQLGWPRLAGFVHMIAALKINDFATAAAELLNSALATETPARAQRLAAKINPPTA